MIIICIIKIKTFTQVISAVLLISDENFSHNYILKTKNNQYLKQISNEYSRYNQRYINDMNERCLDTMKIHFKNPRSDNRIYSTQTLHNQVTNNNTAVHLTGYTRSYSHRLQPSRYSRTITRGPNHHLRNMDTPTINPQLTGHTRSYSNRLQPSKYSRTTTRGPNHHLTNMDTPTTRTQMKPKRLFGREDNLSSIDIELEETNVEFLLLNTLIINAVKVQTVLENFIKGKEYTSIFCFTEIKVDSLDFNPKGIKIFSKHRNKKEKRMGNFNRF